MVHFFTARRYAKRGICRRRVSARLSVCVSVTLRYCIKTAKRRITQTMPHDRSGTLVYTDKRVARSLCHSRASWFAQRAHRHVACVTIRCLTQYLHSLDVYAVMYAFVLQCTCALTPPYLNRAALLHASGYCCFSITLGLIFHNIGDCSNTFEVWWNVFYFVARHLLLSL